MTVGEKIKQLRLEQNLSQTQLAQKLCVSRAAIAKWENNNGLPDIANLKVLADYFQTDVDTLLDETKDLAFRKRTEAVNFAEYAITGRCRNIFDAVVVTKFPDACYISPASLVYDFNRAERIVNVLTLGLLKSIWQLTHWKDYTATFYLVDTVDRQYLVQISGSRMYTTPLSYRYRNIMDEFFVGNRKFLDLHYNLQKNTL